MNQTPATVVSSQYSRKTRKALGRRKRLLRLKADPTLAPKIFEAKSKHSAERKSSFRKKKTRRK